MAHLTCYHLLAACPENAWSLVWLCYNFSRARAREMRCLTRDTRHVMHPGEVPERLNGTVSKTVVVLVATVGSNPTLSAKSCVSRQSDNSLLPLETRQPIPRLSAAYGD